jgi:hypothetical protein
MEVEIDELKKQILILMEEKEVHPTIIMGLPQHHRDRSEKI